MQRRAPAAGNLRRQRAAGPGGAARHGRSADLAHLRCIHTAGGYARRTLASQPPSRWGRRSPRIDVSPVASIGLPEDSGAPRGALLLFQSGADMFDDEDHLRGGRWGTVGRRGQGEARRRARRAGRFRGALSGRGQRRPHRRHRRQPVHPPADPVRHPAPERHLRHRQRGGARAGEPLCRARSAARAGHRHHRPALRLRPGAPGASVPQAARRRQRAEPEAGHHGPRHRPGVRGQVRPPRNPGHRSPPGRMRPSAADRAGRAAPTGCWR